MNNKLRPVAPCDAIWWQVTALLFASGYCALVYQVAWIRSLRLTFGATTAASAAVLAIFMAGLGLGNSVLGRRADDAERPLRLYGLLELAIAISAALSPAMIALIEWAYTALGGQSALGIGGATCLRLFMSALVLGVPTFLMGGTLPSAARAITSTADANRKSFAWLYAINTLGAVAGATATTFYLLENLGTRATLWSACFVNLLLGWYAYRIGERQSVLQAVDAPARNSRRQRRKNSSPPSTADADDNTDRRFPRAIYAVAAVLGFTFFLMELVWYRMLGPILGGTTYTFGIILIVALLGIGLGGFMYGVAFGRLRPTWTKLAFTCGLEAAAIAGPFAFGDRLAILAGRWAEQATGGFGELAAGWFLICLLVVFPAAVVSGLQFPLLIALLGRGRDQLGKQIGFAYAWNTAGAIFGSLAGGFGSLPLLTAVGSWIAVVWLLILLAILLLAATFVVGGRTRFKARIPASIALVVAVACITQPGPTAVWRHSGIGAGRSQMPDPAPNATRKWMHEQQRKLVWQAEGVESSIAITATDGLAFIVNGKSDGNAVSDAATQIGLAIVGAALHPAPQNALVIGLGTGETAGSLADLRDIRQVDVIELESAVIEMARRSSSLNRNVLNRPDVQIHFNDGREFLLTTNNQYDLIVSEPSNPYRAGIATLYTQEFYQSVRQRLRPQGLFLQWLQAYEIDPQSVEIVLSTLRSVFDHVALWQTKPGDMLLVCSNEPISISADELRVRIGEPGLRDALRSAWQVEDLEGFLAHFVASSEFVMDLTRDSQGTLNSDDRTILEFGFAKTVGHPTGFSVEKLRMAAVAGGGRRLPMAGSVDADAIERERLKFNLLFGGELLPEQFPVGPLRNLALALEAYRRADFAAAVDLWPGTPTAASTNFDRLLLAHAYAQLGNSDCLQLLSRDVATRFPAEAAAVKAIYFVRTKQTAPAIESLESLCNSLTQDPLSVPQIVSLALDLAVPATDDNRSGALWLYESMARPWLHFRFDEKRLILRYLLAEQLGPKYVAEALAPLEPNVPWVDYLLRTRFKVYTELKSPAAAQAATDLQWFDEHKDQQY